MPKSVFFNAELDEIGEEARQQPATGKIQKFRAYFSIHTISCSAWRYCDISTMSRGYNDRSRQRVSLLVRNLPLDARCRILQGSARRLTSLLSAGLTVFVLVLQGRRSAREVRAVWGDPRRIPSKRLSHRVRQYPDIENSASISA